MSLSHAILGLLSCKEMTGYDLKYYFDASIKHIWPAHLSQIYRDLKSLEGNGLVDSHIEPQETKPDRRVYRITPKGQQAFLDWMHKTPHNTMSVPRDETSLRMFFGSHLDKKELIFQLKFLVKEKQQLLLFFTQIEQDIMESEFDSEKPFWLLSLRKGLKVAKAEIEWAEECIAELES
ncbi:transcriptional regulator, PadR family [Fontibacillus panacisegetis]|uniref:Transcriptional regulator, PadR family n=1 Tax=Fontibacillus panacisegetis TaxID=670482 RepID=A0A1G7JCM3_9BACL|nr:PadR family transcriptional regulator [Fontibacillus panacisegetis]SDF22524.1 transcriptional regulator, PadR family [Fontibacillus panacisegetis]